jgi:hypothetical protein
MTELTLVRPRSVVAKANPVKLQHSRKSTKLLSESLGPLKSLFGRKQRVGGSRGRSR